MDNSRTTATGVTRRRVLGGIGVAMGAAGLGVAGVEGRANAATVAGAAAGGDPQAGAPVSAVRTVVLGGPDFRPTVGVSFSIDPSTGGLSCPAVATFVADVPLPSGTQITGINVVIKPGSASQAIKLRKYTLSPPAGSDVQGNTTPGGPSVITFPLSAGGLTLDAQSSYRVEVTLQSADAVLYGATIAYVASLSAFVPLAAPVRVYDSRKTTAGKFAADETRMVSLQQALAGIVPTAAVINLTITDTESSGSGDAESGGYVSVFPADIPWPGTSSINWKGTNQNVANAVITAVDANDAIKVLCGVNRTDVVIDLIGYLV